MRDHQWGSGGRSGASRTRRKSKKMGENQGKCDKYRRRQHWEYLTYSWGGTENPVFHLFLYKTYYIIHSLHSAQMRPHRRMVLSDICFPSVTGSMNRCIDGPLTCRNSPFPKFLSCKIYYISIRYTCTNQSVILSDICFQSVTGSMNRSSTGPCNRWIGGLA